MTALTPLDIEHASFRVGMRGYDRNEVEQFRAAVLESVSEYVRLVGQLRSRIAELESQLRHYKDSEELLKSSVMLAQKTGEDVTHSARQQAEAIVAQARLEAERVRAGIADLEAQRERFEFEFYGLLSGFMARLEQRNSRLMPETPAAESQPAADPASHRSSAPPAQRQPRKAAAPRSAPLLAELDAPPAAETSARSTAATAPEGQRRDLDIDDFSAALSLAQPEQPVAGSAPAPRAGSFSGQLPEAWESVEPDVDGAEADPYGAEDEWLEEDLAVESAEYAPAGAVLSAGDHPAVYEDEALEEDALFEDNQSQDDGPEEGELEDSLDQEELDEDELASDELEDEELEDSELDEDELEYEESDDEELEEDGGYDDDDLEDDNLDVDGPQSSAPPTGQPAEGATASEAERPGGLIVHPVDDDDDDDDDTPRVRRTSRW